MTLVSVLLAGVAVGPLLLALVLRSGRDDWNLGGRHRDTSTKGLEVPTLFRASLRHRPKLLFGRSNSSPGVKSVTSKDPLKHYPRKNSPSRALPSRFFKI